MRTQRLRIPLFVLTALAVAAPARPALAAGPAMAECLAANESSIKDRADDHLRAARDEAELCRAPTCPAEVRDACEKRLVEINRAMPTVVFSAKDAAGQDRLDVSVTLDGAPWLASLDGRPVEVDPGPHVFTFRAGELPAVQRTLVVATAEKLRRETIQLPSEAPATAAAPLPAGAPATPIDATPGAVSPATAAPGSTLRWTGVALGAVGVAGVGAGAVFGILAASDWSDAKAACNGKPVSCTTDPSSPGAKDKSSADTKAAVSTVGFVAGGALLAGGIVMFLLAPKEDDRARPTRAAIEVTPSAGPRGGELLLRGQFE